MRRISLLLIALWSSLPAFAATPQEILNNYAKEAKAENPAFKEFSASRGDAFYHAKGAKQTSCASCHTADPKMIGAHEKTHKEIKPLAPSINAERLTDPAKVEKWFKRNCGDVLDRPCTSQEKGDFLSYLLSIH